MIQSYSEKKLKNIEMWGSFGNSRTTYTFVISASEQNIDRACYIATYVYVTTSNYDAYTANAEGSILKIATNFFLSRSIAAFVLISMENVMEPNMTSNNEISNCTHFKMIMSEITFQNTHCDCNSQSKHAIYEII